MGKEVGYIAIVVASSLPAFKVLHAVTTQKWVVCSTTVTSVVTYPSIFLVVTDKARDGTVDTFVSVATIGQVSCPMMEGRVVLTTMAPLNRKAPALFVDFFSKNVSSPGTVVTRLAIAPNVHIDKVEAFTKFILQIFPTCQTAMCQVISCINVDPLVQPVPAIAIAAIWILTKNIFIEVFRFRISFRSVNVDTKICTILLSFLNQGLKVFSSTNTLSNICVVQVTRVMSLTTISFKENTLSKTICMEIDLLDTIQSHKEWVLCL